MADNKPVVFICYSHEDKAWKDMLVSYLTVLELGDRIALWDDTRIGAGEAWFDEIQAAMENAEVAAALISTASLRSRFIREHEFPYLVERRGEHGLRFLPVLVEPCPWKQVNWLKQLQPFIYEGKSLSELDERVALKRAMTDIIDQIAQWIDARPTTPIPLASDSVLRSFGVLGTELKRSAPKPAKVSLDRLPVTGSLLFGRNDELNLLDDAWDNPDTNIVVFKAFGGVGKSTLVNKWVEQMEANSFHGAKSVYAWSFQSRGAFERATFADLFIEQALKWYGDEEPEKGSPVEKGRRLADLVRKERSLLILDGLEPLQTHQAEERGRLRDPAVAALLTELAKKNPGLCLVTSRESVADLHRFKDTVIEKNLENISPEAGRALLRVKKIRGAEG